MGACWISIPWRRWKDRLLSHLLPFSFFHGLVHTGCLIYEKCSILSGPTISSLPIRSTLVGLDWEFLEWSLGDTNAFPLGPVLGVSTQNLVGDQEEREALSASIHAGSHRAGSGHDCLLARDWLLMSSLRVPSGSGRVTNRNQPSLFRSGGLSCSRAIACSIETHMHGPKSTAPLQLRRLTDDGGLAWNPLSNVSSTLESKVIRRGL